MIVLHVNLLEPAIWFTGILVEIYLIGTSNSVTHGMWKTGSAKDHDYE